MVNLFVLFLREVSSDSKVIQESSYVHHDEIEIEERVPAVSSLENLGKERVTNTIMYIIVSYL